MDVAIGMISALIAAFVSLTIALITVLVNKSVLRAEREKFEIELQRKMTDKLYDLRIETYPKAVEITEGLRKSRLAEQGESVSEEYFKVILAHCVNIG